MNPITPRPLIRGLMLAALLGSTSLAAPLAAKTITVTAGGNAQEKVQTALIDAQPGDVVELGAGRYEFTDGLSLDVDKVTVRGAGADKTILSFKGQKGSGEGLLVTSDDVLLRDFAVEDSKGDGIKAKGSTNITFYKLAVTWTGGPKETNGAYGVYPVSSTNVLVDSVTVSGASDAGIYVGQSKNIIVRNSTAHYNVAGIEIENSYDADVHNNVATHNTGGILVFDLPNLPQMGGRNINVFANKISNNDTPNFAPKGNIVATVPNGTGVLIMANENVHIFDNEISDNATTNILIAGYRAPFEDKNYNPVSRNVVVYNNKLGRAGWAPGPQFPGGADLAAAFGGQLPPVIWDGTGSGIVIHESPALSLGLASPSADLSTIKPQPIAPAGAVDVVKPTRITLPQAMEDAIK